MKKILPLVILLVLFSFKSASAHMLTTDKGTSVLLHIDPNDDPVAGQQSTIHFEISDPLLKFKLSDCNCFVTVVFNGKQLYRTDIKATLDKSIYTGFLPYTFPNLGVYEIKLSANPKAGGEFTAFNAKYDVRIDKINKDAVQQSTATRISSLFAYVLVVCAFVYIVLLFLLRFIRRT